MSSTKVETKEKTSNAVKILDSMMGNDPEAKRLLDEARVNAAVSLIIYEARNKAGLSQAELAQKVGTTQSVISRLEDADYDGHSLSMLYRIAEALNKRLQVRFVTGGTARLPRHDHLEDYELRDWCKKFDCTPEELKKAVKKVGTSTEKVEEYLTKERA